MLMNKINDMINVSNDHPVSSWFAHKIHKIHSQDFPAMSAQSLPMWDEARFLKDPGRHQLGAFHVYQACWGRLLQRRAGMHPSTGPGKHTKTMEKSTVFYG